MIKKKMKREINIKEAIDFRLRYELRKEHSVPHVNRILKILYRSIGFNKNKVVSFRYSWRRIHKTIFKPTRCVVLDFKIHDGFRFSDDDLAELHNLHVGLTIKPERVEVYLPINYS